MSEHEVVLFRRPRGWLTRHLNKGLGEAPDDMPDLAKYDIDWKRVPVPSFVFVALTLAAVIGLSTLLWQFLPFVRYSVLSGILAILPLSDQTVRLVMAIGSGLFVALIVLMAMSPSKNTHMIVHSPQTADQDEAEQSSEDSRESSASAAKMGGLFGRGFSPAAAIEELWFRTGCENWTWRQRVYSCVYFGIIHFFNLIVPISVTIALMLSGAVYMAVYLRAYKRTDSRLEATLTAARFHGRYNLLVIGTIMLSGIAVLAVALFELL